LPLNFERLFLLFLAWYSAESCNKEVQVSTYDPNRMRVQQDNSGAWYIGIIILVANILVAMVTGVLWWWAGWGGNKATPATADICKVSSSPGGIYSIEDCGSRAATTSALSKFALEHPDSIIAVSERRDGSLLLVTKGISK
jgi:hypothetical protein